MKFMIVAMQIVLAAFCLYHESSVASAESSGNAVRQEPQITIMLQRIYLDGEVSQEIFREEVVNLEKLFEQYKDWQLVDRDDVQIVLQQRIDDISPLLKTSGYFGVSKEGILQIFNGVPENDNAIHSFFQIDMKKMKSYQREQLKRGIRVKSKERFVKVMKDMEQYSMRNGNSRSVR
ncbi:MULTISPECIES: BofC C-terminal domain-containing protein [unclassified Bacillus (in: firmicutes)]|uniref:BofC C-terminal domain-containing protein n=1 Tax=unclassified Bacillus (in: firmicutes) TaxID=185979 RepID=UPI0008E9C3A3|nr:MULTISPECIES: BofC C-terminal domain-containing protein [unclassified Bacillus (in: firmicutes)]SFK02089.1 forespore regulator of the sigma-K checkpoint [Bacillus sp. 71mf]SFS52526.1 forespore regulator of the sigma-K checkpoint [Bacillus sp. 103mf]